MPRVARIIAKNYPYHVTQRRNYRQAVFETDADYRQYLAWFKEYSDKYSLDVWAYCLMSNHVHFVCVPRNDNTLARTLNTLHMRYSQYYNRKKGVTGHLWQGRYYSSILDDMHLYAAIRYVENNPVRAGIVQEPEDYTWSSARGHCGIVSDNILSDTCHLCEEIDDWSQYLRDDESAEVVERLKVNVISGKPCGDEDFIKVIETVVGRSPLFDPGGGPENNKRALSLFKKDEGKSTAMLKTTVDKPGKPNKLLLAFGILQGYIKRPLWFLLTTLISLPSFRKQIPEDLPKEFLKTTELQTWMYIRLKSKIGQEKAYEIIRTFVLPIGLAVQQGNFRNAEAPRTFGNLIAYQQRTNREGPTRWNEMEVIEQSKQKYEFRVKSCMFHKFFTQLGVPELTKLMCEVDNAIFNTYLPEEVTFHRNGLGNRIVDGASECHFVIEHHHKTKEIVE